MRATWSARRWQLGELGSVRPTECGSHTGKLYPARAGVIRLRAGSARSPQHAEVEYEVPRADSLGTPYSRLDGRYEFPTPALSVVVGWDHFRFTIRTAISSLYSGLMIGPVTGVVASTFPVITSTHSAV